MAKRRPADLVGVVAAVAAAGDAIATWLRPTNSFPRQAVPMSVFVALVGWWFAPHLARRLPHRGGANDRLARGASGRPGPDYYATLREFAATVPQLGGRVVELHEITKFATGSVGYRWLEAGPYSGKSTLMAAAVVRELPDEIDVLAYFVSRRDADADRNRFLAAVVPQLAFLVDEDPLVTDHHRFRALWQRATVLAAERRRHMLLVVDGLDEDLCPAGQSIAALLPVEAGGWTHVHVTSRLITVPTDVAPEHPLRITPRVHLKAFRGAHEHQQIAQREIDELVDRHNTPLEADVLGLLAAAAGPLAANDLVALTDDDPNTVVARRRKVREVLGRRAGRSLEARRSTSEPRYRFAHYSLLQRAQNHPGLDHPEYRERIHAWADQYRAAGWTVSGQLAPEYLFDSHPTMLGNDQSRLLQLVTDAGWVLSGIQVIGVDRVMASVRQASAGSPGHREVAAWLSILERQARHLRSARPEEDADFVLLQLTLQAAAYGDTEVVDKCKELAARRPPARLGFCWISRQPERFYELGRCDHDISTVAVLHDGRVVTGGSDDGTISIWDPRNPGTEPIILGSHGDAVMALAEIPDGRIVSSGTWAAEQLLLWDPSEPGREPVELGRDAGWNSALATLPNGLVLGASGGELGSESRLLLWDPAILEANPTAVGRHDGAAAIAVLPNGQVVTASGGLSLGTIKLWDQTLCGPPAPLGDHGYPVTAMVVLPDGRVVTAGGGTMLVWDPAHPGAAPEPLGSCQSFGPSIAALPDGKVASAGAFGELLLWDPTVPGGQTDPEMRTLFESRGDANRSYPSVFGFVQGGAGRLAALPDGRVLSTGPARLRVWDPTTSSSVSRQQTKVGPTTSLADGRVVSVAAGQLIAWNPSARGPAEAISMHLDSVKSLAILPDGRLVVAQADSGFMRAGAESRLLLADPRQPDRAPTLLGRTDTFIRAIAVIDDGRVASIDERTVRLWNPAVPKQAPAIVGHHDGAAWNLAAFPGRRLVSIAKGVLLLWDAGTEDQQPTVLGRHERIVAWRESPDGRIVLPDGTAVPRHGRPIGVMGVPPPIVITRDDVPDGEPIVLEYENAGIEAVIATSDGQLVTGGYDGRLLLWDPAPGTDPELLGHHRGGLRALAALADNRMVVSSGPIEDEVMVIWDLAERSVYSQANIPAIAFTVLCRQAPTGPDLLAMHRDGGVSAWAVSN